MLVSISKNLINNCIDTNKLKINIKNQLIFDQILVPNEELFFEIDEQNKFQGIIIKSKNLLISYTAELNNNDKIKGRNTFLSQPLVTALKIALKNNYSFFLSLNPNSFHISYKIPNSILRSFRILKTCNINFTKLIQNISPYNSINEFIDDITNISNKNSRNSPTYILSKDDELQLFAKCEGANFKDSFLILLCLLSLNKEKPVFFIPLTDINKSDIELLKLLKLIYKNLNLELDKEIINEPNISILEEISLKRNQLKFTKNIINKYTSENINCNQCFACDYNITQNLISAHIHRFSDINNDYQKNLISKEEAIKLSISGNNGFLLCPNHDKEFEKGMIIFDININKFIPNIKNIHTNKFYDDILKKLKSQNFNKNLYNDEFYKNIQKHINRINN